MMSSADARESASGSSPHKPIVSIVIPVHNKATITQQCLDALLAEPDDGVAREIIVVDDGSSDMTERMLAGYGARILVIRNDVALGFAGACNAGVAAAAGEYLVLLNNDTIPTVGWLRNLVAHAIAHPEAAVVGAKLLFPNDTIQHAGVVFGLDSKPHHIYIGFPGDHPAASVSRRFQVVTAACALFRRGPWEEFQGLDTAYRNGWEDVDYCLRAGEAGYEIHYCAESTLYHLESATRDLLSATELANQALFAERWGEKIVPDDFGYYWVDGLFSAQYGARYPIQLSVSSLLAGVTVGEDNRLADKLLYDRARQVMILLRNNIVLNVRVQEAEARAADAERRLSEASAATISSVDRPGPAEDASELDSPAPADDGPVEQAEVIPGPASHRILGRVESPGTVPDVVTDGVLMVSGWVSTRGRGAQVDTLIDGLARGEIVYGLPRPDVAKLLPALPEGEHCGFSGEIPVADLADGPHTLIIRFSASDEDAAELSTIFEVDNHAYETGRILARLDTPVRGATFLFHEVASVSGWALAPSGIKQIESKIDGEARGTIAYGGLRPDIARIRQRYADADHCGFSGSVSMLGIEDGHHELTLELTANDDRILELKTRIVVDNESVIDAGLPMINKQYQTWLKRSPLTAERFAALQSEMEDLRDSPLIEIVVAIEGDCVDALQSLGASMLAQVFPNWRLTIVESGSSTGDAQELAQQFCSEDDRIRFLRVEDRTGLATAWSKAAQCSDAEWIGFFRTGLQFSPTAFLSVARSLATDPHADVMYSDDDRVDPERMLRWNPFFKPDWSPDLLLSMSYLGPFTLFRRSILRDVGWLRGGLPGAELHDLALRVTERTSNVRHLPEILATTIEIAPKAGERWPTDRWIETERRALRDALERRDVKGIVERGNHPGRWRIRYLVDELPRVTAVIPTGGNLNLLRPCLDDLLLGTNYAKLDILVVDNSCERDVELLVSELAQRHPNLQRIEAPIKPFNYSALVNAALPLISSPYVLMLNDDISVIDSDWLQAMVEHAVRPGVGIVGAKLLFPDDTIQHAGVVLGPFEGSVHVFKRFPGNDPGYFDLPDVVRNFSAVTFACALIDRTVFDEIGGLDEVNLPVAFNDTDFCLRAREAGFEVIYTPHATLYHHESVTKTVIAHPHEIEYLRSRWGHVIAHDPFYNPNLTRQGEDARLNMEPTSAG